MTATYVPVLTARDQVRLEVGDTDVPANAMLQDEEIDHFLAQEGNGVLAAAARCARAIAGRFSRLVDTTEGDVSVKMSQAATAYATLAEVLADRATSEGGTAVPYAGGISVADVDARNADTDRVPNLFTRRTGAYGSVAADRTTRWWP